MDFVEICNVYIGKMIIKAAKRIYSYSDLNFGVTFFGTQCSLTTSQLIHYKCSRSSDLNFGVTFWNTVYVDIIIIIIIINEND